MSVQRLYPSQLSARLQQSLEPCYLIFGEEPLQRSEAVSAICRQAREAGFTEIERFTLDGETQWAGLADALQSLSLFAERRVINIDIGEQAMPADGATLLLHYANQVSSDIILILHGGKLDKKAQNSKWFKALSAHGPYVQALPLQGDRLHKWLRQRCHQFGVSLSAAAGHRLLEAYEGNMLALAQEIEKLALLHPAERVELAQVEASLVDQSRFNVFQLVDALLAAQRHTALHMLMQLQQTGQEPVIISWALTREVSLLMQLHAAQHAGQLADAMKKSGVWRSRQPLIKNALQRLPTTHLAVLAQRLALLDATLKGATAIERDPWPLLQEICLLLTNQHQAPAALVEEKW